MQEETHEQRLARLEKRQAQLCSESNAELQFGNTNTYYLKLAELQRVQEELRRERQKL